MSDGVEDFRESKLGLAVVAFGAVASIAAGFTAQRLGVEAALTPLAFAAAMCLFMTMLLVVYQYAPEGTGQ